MIELSDGLITRRARLAERMAERVEADRRVDRCKRIDFSHDGGALLAVELLPTSDAKSLEAVARELEFAISQAEPALPWIRVQVV
jgi:hypothetical protein